MTNDKIEELKKEIKTWETRIKSIDGGKTEQLDRKSYLYMLELDKAKLQAYEEAQKEINDLKEEVERRKLSGKNFDELIEDKAIQMTYPRAFEKGLRIGKEQTSKKVEEFNKVFEEARSLPPKTRDHTINFIKEKFNEIFINQEGERNDKKH